MLVETDILPQLAERGYNVLHITSKLGAYVNHTKVNRENSLILLHHGVKTHSRNLLSFIIVYYLKVSM